MATPVGRMAAFAARERLRSHRSTDLFRTHRFTGASALAVATIDTDAVFPVRSAPVTFRTKIEITENAGVHAGLVFEFGDTDGGCALWIEDEKIGFHAGADGDDDGATAIYDRGEELPPGLVLELVAVANPGTGEVRLFGNGLELARATAEAGRFDPLEWSADGDGSFASAEAGTTVFDVPAGSVQAPDGFVVLEPLSVYVGQAPQHSFV